MRQTVQLAESLKRILKSRGLVYADLAKRLDVSEPTIKRMFSTHAMTMERFEQICDALDVSILDVARMAQHADGEESRFLTYEQEEALVADHMRLCYFYLLLRHWTPKQVKRHFALNDKQDFDVLMELDRMGLVEVHPKGRVRMRVSSQVAWIPNGPIQKMFEGLIRPEFLDSAFAGEGESLSFVPCELSVVSMRLIARKIDLLMREVKEMAEVDALLPKEETHAFGVLSAYRPWMFSAFRPCSH